MRRASTRGLRPPRSPRRPTGGRAHATILTALALLVAACAATDQRPIETELGDALAERYALSDAVTSCLAAGLVDQVAEADLAERGFGDQGPTIGSASSAIAEVVALAPTVADPCLDLEEHLGRLVEPVGDGLAVGCVEHDRLDVWPLLDALLAANDTRSTPVSTIGTLPGQGLAQLLEVVRGCVDDATFAELAGLDHPDDLRAALIADPFARSQLVADQDRCIVDVVVDSVGIERLFELGVTVDQPNLFQVRARLGDEELARLVEAFAECDLRHQLLRAISVTDEQIGPCILEAVEPGTEQELATSLFDGRQPLDDPALSSAADRCAALAVAERFRPPRDVPDEVQIVTTVAARPYLYLWSSAGRFEQACLPAGLATVTDETEVGTLSRLSESIDQGIAIDEAGSTGQGLSATERAYLIEVADVLSACLRPWSRLLPSLWAAGVEPATFDCIRAEVGDPALASMMEAEGPARWGDDPGARAAYGSGLAAVEDAVGACGTAADVTGWQDHVVDAIGDN